MSEMKRTPGPWKILSGIHAILPEGQKVEIPVCCIEREGRKPNQNVVAGLIPLQADADLIAAAPEMLAALEAMIAAMPGTIPGSMALVHAVTSARKAIAKAKGA